MLLDFEVANCSRVCSRTGRALAAGESYFSTLHLESGRPVRRDFAASAWEGPPETALAWWRSRMVGSDGAKPKLAPQEVLLSLFSELAAQPSEAEFRYLLGLLLVRRRILKLTDSRRDLSGEWLLLDCPCRDEQFELRVAAPTDEAASQLDKRLFELLYDGE